MTNKRMTKKDWFAEVIAIVANAEHERKDEILGFLNHEVEMLTNKSSNSKPSARQVENEEIKAKLIEVLSGTEEPIRVSELMKCEGLDYSSQRLSALLKQLVDEKKVVKAVEKKVSYFSIAE